mgnify:CR=1 FL=1
MPAKTGVLDQMIMMTKYIHSNDFFCDRSIFDVKAQVMVILMNQIFDASEKQL